MEINNHQDLIKATEEAGALLQQIQNYLEQEGLNWVDIPEARVRFPRGFIRAAGAQRRRVPFIRAENLRHNLAYTLMLSDTILWLWLRTDIFGVPKEMLCKLQVFLMGTLCESITKDYLYGVCGRNYRGRLEFLRNRGTIDENLEKDLNWLWTTRNKMHLFQVRRREFDTDYDETCHHRAIQTFRNCIHAINEAGPADV